MAMPIMVGGWLGYPFDGHNACVGHGTMTAFQFIDPKEVDALYQLAMHNGGRDEGPPGYRPQYDEGFYAAYVRDLDGNKLAFVVFSGNSVYLFCRNPQVGGKVLYTLASWRNVSTKRAKAGDQVAGSGVTK
ncbi:hypothetical protein [Vreelandella zhaodongensis]|uniref:hypothetical protein n=1 Tax=Vreelandella zhaodongensis TaxID=1176240 RepID=UPI003EB9414B